LHYATTPLVDVNKNKIKKRKEEEEEEEEEESTSSATTLATVWYMKDYDSKEWVLKHTVSNDEMWSITAVDYTVAAIHPDCDFLKIDNITISIIGPTNICERKKKIIRSQASYPTPNTAVSYLCIPQNALITERKPHYLKQLLSLPCHRTASRPLKHVHS
jgi:hypothetical protein